MSDWRRSYRAAFSGRSAIFPAVIFQLFIVVTIFFSVGRISRAQSTPNTAWSVTIVLPPKVVAGKPATLAVFGADGKLASGVTVEVTKDQRVVTDTTGRATITAPTESDVVIARASGGAVAALVDADGPATGAQPISVALVISRKDSFSICGGKFRGEGDANRVKINEERALVLAASPECLVVLPGPKVAPGLASISIQTGEAHWTAATTVVSLEFEPPHPELMPEKKSKLEVRAVGTEQPLQIVAENQTPGVLKFTRGDVQHMRTSGGANNLAAIEVQAIRSGEFSFHARMAPPSDPVVAERYMRAALSLAPKELLRRLKSLTDRIARHPHDTEKAKRELEQIISTTIAGDLRTLLECADVAL
ncbi:MAG TPA: hypothetical protein VEX69_01605 [Candidatus Limnocylindria bacterium]|nr:hypothetical protein [Candidatus Limnocylindria bacterium]